MLAPLLRSVRRATGRQQGPPTDDTVGRGGSRSRGEETWDPGSQLSVVRRTADMAHRCGIALLSRGSFHRPPNASVVLGVLRWDALTDGPARTPGMGTRAVSTPDASANDVSYRPIPSWANRETNSCRVGNDIQTRRSRKKSWPTKASVPPRSVGRIGRRTTRYTAGPILSS